MTTKTDANGKLDSSGKYGPYLLAMPVNPMDDSSDMDTTQDGDGGWAYDEKTGLFQADDGSSETSGL